MDSREQARRQSAVAEVIEHMNICHPERVLRLAQTAGGVPGATTAWAVGFDSAGIDLLADSETGPAVIRLSWSRPVVTMADLRYEVALLHVMADEAAG